MMLVRSGLGLTFVAQITESAKFVIANCLVKSSGQLFAELLIFSSLDEGEFFLATLNARSLPICPRFNQYPDFSPAIFTSILAFPISIYQNSIQKNGESASVGFLRTTLTYKSSE